MKLLVNLLIISIALASEMKDIERKAYASMTGEPGSYCKLNRDCFKANRCDLDLKRYGFGTCLGNQAVGLNCDANYECKTGNCDYRTSSCKRKGTGREDGNDCKKNSDCDSGLCGANRHHLYTSVDGLSNWGCYSVGEPGAKCLHSWECTVRCDFDKKKCAARKGRTGSKCAEDSDCNSKKCAGGFIGFGKCVEKKRNGSTCLYRNDCKSNYCMKTNDCTTHYSSWFKKRVKSCKKKCSNKRIGGKRM